MALISERTLRQRQLLFLALVFILVVSVFCICVSLLVVNHPKKEEYTVKNILFIVVDDLRPALGCYGDKRAITPNTNALASQSIIFKNAYTQQALCAPSRTSFLTSRRPDSLCLYDNGRYWRDTVGNFTSLPQHFKDFGYETISVGKVFHHGKVSNKTDDYPYSWTQFPYRPPTMKYKMKPVCPTPDGKRMNLVCPVDVEMQPERSLPDIENTKFAIEYLRNKSSGPSRDEPFFLGVGYYKPHIPFKFPQEYLDLYPIQDMDLAPHHTLPPHLQNVSWNPWTDIRERDDVKALNVSFPFGPLPEDFQKLARQGYYASLSYMDDQLGKLFEALETYGFADNTAIVLFGDHGWSLGEHQEWSKYSNFEVSVRVPLIVYVPGLTSGKDKVREHFKHIPVLGFIPQNGTFMNDLLNATVHDPPKPAYVSQELVELVDLFPTMAEIANISVPPLCRLFAANFCSEGISFYSVIKAHVNPPQSDIPWKTAAFSQYPRPSTEILENSDQPEHKDIHFMGYTIRTNRFRYTEWVHFNNTRCKPDMTQTVAFELYDHKHDSFEINNVYDNKFYKTVAKDMAKKLRLGWRHALPEDFYASSRFLP